MRSPKTLIAIGLMLVLAACSAPADAPADARADGTEASDATKETPVIQVPDEPVAGDNEETDMTASTTPAATQIATFGAGCFWCVEAVLEQLDGVDGVASGYMGGSVENPTYRAVCDGTTGHAEVVQVTFRPEVISYDTLLDWFWQLHDPTTLNRQGGDAGTQYRSAIYYHSDAQRDAAEAAKGVADASGTFANPIVTEITKAAVFYEAEDYHQDYYRLNGSQPYCRAVIKPKLSKLGLKE